MNIGCGLTPTPGWENYDNSLSIYLARKPAAIRLMHALGLLGAGQDKSIDWYRKNPTVKRVDARKRLPGDDMSVEVIYTSHMLEHLDGDEVSHFLREALRVLIPTGVLRVAVPDLSVLIKRYLVHGDADLLLHDIGVSQKKTMGLREKLKSLLVGPRHHMWMYDGPSLCRLLAGHGFQHPVILPEGQTTIADPGALNLYERSDVSVYVEARVPGEGM